MPWFEYDGLTPGGTAIAGRLEAIDRDQAMGKLVEMQIDVRELRDAKPPRPRRAPLGEDDLIFLNEQLASLAEAGIALDEGLAQLARDIESPRLRTWINEVVHDIRRGVPIDEAIGRREYGLPLLYSRVIRAGIQSGNLPATLLNLNHHLRLESDTRRLIWEVASYPLLVGIMALTVVSGFMLFVADRFRAIFADFGTTLPGLTVLLLEVADNYVLLLTVFGSVLGAMLLVWWLLRLSPGGRLIRESIVLSLPIIGRIHRASVVARFLRSVASAVATGIPLPQAMRLGSDATGSGILMRDAEYLASEVERGQSILAAGQSTHVIPPLFGFCVQVAAGRQALPTAIAQLAMSYENRALHTQAMLRAVLFPVLVLVLGGFLFFGIGGMFLPLIHLINAISSC